MRPTVAISPMNFLPADVATPQLPLDGTPAAKVLVLLASFNGAKWIREQLQSILAQSGTEVAITVGDDGSTDATLALIAPFQHDGRVRLLQHSLPSGSAGQNFLALIRQHPADGFDFVAFADQDDVWYARKLSMACEKLVADAAAGYSSGTLAIWDDGRTAYLKPSGKQNRSDFLLEGAGQGCTFVLRAEFYARVRGFVLDHTELTSHLHYHDWAIYALARSWGLRWSFDPRPSMVYRQHRANDTGARGTVGGVTRRFALVRRGWYREQLVAICALCTAAAPDNRIVAIWRSILSSRRSLRRGCRLAGFCLRGGRRRMRDNVMVLVAVFVGWI
jgi:rhamnosyltransferase